MTVLHLVKPAPPEIVPDPQVVDALERMLVHAKAGKILAVAIATVQDCEISNTTVWGQHYGALLGSVAAMQHDLINAAPTG